MAVILTWRNPLIISVTTLDSSWLVALQRAASLHFAFGRDIVFNYGPLGFLAFPHILYPIPWLLALVYWSALTFALSWMALRLASRATLGPLAYLFATAIVVLAAAGTYLARDGATIFAFLVGTAAITRTAATRYGSVFAFGAGFFSALQYLIKLNSGIVVGAIFFFVLVSQSDPVRRLLLFFGGLVTGLAISAALGLVSVLAYVRQSFELVTGYSQAMVLTLQPADRFRRRLELAAAICVLVLIFSIAWRISRAWRPSMRRGFLAIVVIFAVSEFKEGFVRQDRHAVIFFVLVASAAIALNLSGPSRARAATIIIVGLAIGDGAFHPVPLVNDPGPAALMFARQVGTALSSARRASTIALQRRLAMQALDIGPSVLAQLTDKAVHIDPWETSVVWAYPQVKWRPLPVFQSYAAVTSRLDQTNARFLRSSRAPDLILRQIPQAIDRRFPFFESPAAALETLCRYRHTTRDPKWETLRRERNVCGTPRVVSSVRATLREAIPVPAVKDPRNVLVARVHTSRSFLERLVAFSYRAPSTFVRLNGRQWFRFIPSTGENGLLLSVPQGLNYPGEWTIPAIHQLEFEKAGWAIGRDVRIEFLEIPTLPARP